MLCFRYGNMEIKEQTQVFVTGKEHTFWTDGYFACSVGNVSEEMLRKYIENKDNNRQGGVR